MLSFYILCCFCVWSRGLCSFCACEWDKKSQCHSDNIDAEVRAVNPDDMDNQFSVDTNNCFSPLAAWVGYGDKQDLGIVTFIVYGLEEREKEGLRISTILRNFVYDCFGFEDWLVVLRLNVPVNNFSVMSGRSHRFLGN